MSDEIKHECGIAHIRLLKSLDFYKKKYGSAFYGINKMYLLMEKQHNRGQDGAGFASIKLNVEPGKKFISRIRSIEKQPIQDLFSKINNRINSDLKNNPNLIKDTSKLKTSIPYLAESLLGHVRYGTFGGNSMENVQPLLRQNNWKHRNLILAGNFNMTNVAELFNNLIELGQHPKEYSDTITIMEKIGHYLDDAVRKMYKELKKEGYSKMECSELISDRLDVSRVLKKASKNWDGGYVMGGLLGHGDSFVMRDPTGIRPAFYYKDDEVVVVASERPAIQNAFNIDIKYIKELEPGSAIIVKNKGEVTIKKINKKADIKACSFERIYFSRGNDADIYSERKNLGKYLIPQVLDAIDSNLRDTIFSYIPNTSETCFLGMMDGLKDYLINKKQRVVIDNKPHEGSIRDLLSFKVRIENLVSKDVKMRTFIADDDNRNELVSNVYDTTHGIVNPNKDTVVLIDDSIVRGTTAKKIINLIRTAGAKEIHMRISSPPISGPCWYGIDTPNRQELIAGASSIEEIKEFIGADSLKYLSVEGLHRAVQGKGYCDACFTGQYPVNKRSN